MVDFSRKKFAQQHHDSFRKAANDVILLMQNLQKEYDETFNIQKRFREERDKIIEETAMILGNNNYKFERPLKNCNNSEINRRLLELLDSLPERDRELVQINLLKINNRQMRINELGKELESFSEKLSYFRVPEGDEKEEVVLIIPKKEKKTHEEIIEDAKRAFDGEEELDKKVEEIKETEPIEAFDVIEEPKLKEEVKEVKEEVKVEEPTITKDVDEEGLEKLVNVHRANRALVEDLDNALEARRVIINETEEIPVEEETEDLLDKELDAIQKDIDAPIEEAEEPEKENTVLFTLDGNISLKNIAENVYKSVEYWKEIYKYGTNRVKIARIAEEYSIEIEDVVSEPMYLKDITLEFPTMLSVEEIQEDETEYMMRAA